jgi:6-pyruvoyltetrahydropterin/6-carboxytetrahydropterin synthase
METFKEFTFEAAHLLPNLPQSHPCGRLHGHSFRLRVGVAGPMDEHKGWVVDFAQINAALMPHLSQLDHRYLNDVPGLENPTCENIARWLWTRVQPALPGLVSMAVYETPECGCIYRGE